MKESIEYDCGYKDGAYDGYHLAESDVKDELRHHIKCSEITIKGMVHKIDELKELLRKALYVLDEYERDEELRTMIKKELGEFEDVKLSTILGREKTKMKEYKVVVK